jgi:hypothetical protein
MIAMKFRTCVAGVLLGAIGIAGGCAKQPTSSAARNGEQVRYAADLPPVQPVKPPMPVAPPEQPPVKPVKPPMPDKPDPENTVDRQNKELREQNRELQATLEERAKLLKDAQLKSEQVKHVVVLWLKKHGDKAGRDALLGAGDVIKTIPGVVDVSVGECMPSERPVVDSTYDVAVIITFKDKAAMDAYATHPKHVKLLEDVLKPNVEKYVVYDFVAK